MLLQIDLDVGVGAAEGGQVFGQELDNGRNVGMHTHVALDARGIFVQVHLQPVHVEQYGACVVQEGFPGGGEIHPAGVAVKQGGIDVCFQVGQAFAHGRGCQLLALGGARYGAFFAYGHEQLHGREVQAACGGVLGGQHGVGSAVLAMISVIIC